MTVRIKCHRLVNSDDDETCSKNATVDRKISVPLQPTSKSDKWVIAYYAAPMCDEHAEEYDTRH